MAVSAIVKQVLSGDSFVLKGKPVLGVSPEATVSLAYVNVPRSSKDSEEPFAYEAKEFVRKLLVGKIVSYQIEFTSSNSRDFVSITVSPPVNEETDLAKILIKEGFAKYRTSELKRSITNEDSETYSELEKEAALLEKGIHGCITHHTILKISPPNIQDFYRTYKSKVISGVLEHVRDGSSLRIYLVSLLLDENPCNPVFQNINLNLCGVKAPTFRKDVPNTPDLIEPFGAEAKSFVESRLLQKDVTVILEGVSNNNLIGSVLHPKGNIALVLLEEGLARIQEWSIPSVTKDSHEYRLAESQAKEKRLRIWKDLVGSSNEPIVPQVLEVTVIKILQPDCLLIKDAQNSERKVFLSSIRVPRTKDDRETYFNSEAREYLRNRLIGKKVSYKKEFIKPAQEGFEEKETGTIIFDSINIAEALVSKGFATVLRHRNDDNNRSTHYDSLLIAEDRAKSDNKGMHSDKPIPILRIVDASENSTKSNQFLPSLQRAGNIPAIVEHCMNGSRFKLYLPNQSYKMTFILSGIRVPRLGKTPNEKGDPFSKEAFQFVNDKISQRDVQVIIEGTDKTGGFIGTILLYPINQNNKNTTLNQGKLSNLAVLLVEQGLAFVQNSGNNRHLEVAETTAKSLKKGVWSIESNFGNLVIEPGLDDQLLPPLKNAIITDVSGERFHCQIKSTELDKLGLLSIEMSNYYSKNQSDKIPKKGELVAAQFSVDKKWYRAKVLSIQSNSVQVIYIDYGNQESVPISCIKDISTFGKLVPQAVECQLAFINPVEPLILSGQVQIGVLFKKEGVSHVVLYVDGECMNIELVREGLATTKKTYSESVVKPLSVGFLIKSIVDGQALAKKERLNAWRYGDFNGDDEL